ncbi:D-amino-acid transaminase [Iodidimonas sp. SYSU 1G8]|uniref:D-amino-acid transaminase n=1 Tax=Iodidimonas sp. SYSU 1G8 TaxID=3133967 RepID=UPI0031FF3260
MSRVAYVNGRYLPYAHAAIHVDDRAVQFADAAYEVIAVIGGRIADLDPHLDRLDRSLGELRIANYPPRAALAVIARQMVRRNRLDYGLLYIQIGRGAPGLRQSPRDSTFPKDLRPSVVMTCRPLDFRKVAARAATGVAVATMPDQRWARVDIKAVSLLPNALAKQAAREAGAFEAWMVDRDGNVTEGASTNAWIVTADGTLVTRPLSSSILAGITRHVVIAQAREAGLRVEERAFTVAEALAAKEAFFTSTTGGPIPVVTIDGKTVANGAPGETTEKLVGLYRRHLASFAADPAAAFQVLGG